MPADDRVARPASGPGSAPGSAEHGAASASPSAVSRRTPVGHAFVLARRLTVCLLAALANGPAVAQHGAVGGEWREYGGDTGGTKYAPLGQIHAGNVDDLEIRWRWSSPDNPLLDRDRGRTIFAFESTPLMKGGVLYTSTSFSQVAAIDARTGEQLWVHDPGSYLAGRPANNGFLHRGLAWWTDGTEEALYIATGDARLIALEPSTGRPRAAFGSAGEVDLKAGIRSLNNRSDQFGNSSPPIVVGDVVVVGSSVMDWAPRPEWPPGDVRGFDARTGELLWTFHTVPRRGEFGYSTWEDGSAERVGGANVWAPMTADLELGYVYLPVSAPSNHFFGGHRKGDNLFANSIVCLDARTGRRVWHYQTVRHDIWDYDLGSPPNLVDITVDGQEIPAIAQVSKQGWVWVFDRRNGTPVWPIEEVPVPESTVPGERTAPTQPRPVKPPPFGRLGIEEDELNDGAEDALANLDWGPIYTPPSVRGAVISPGLGGGANWGGAAFDPVRSRLYVPVQGVVPFWIRMYPSGVSGYYLYETGIQTAPGNRYLLRPPWGHITAYDLDRGEILWQRANDGANGYAGQAAVLATQDLLFYANRSRRGLTVFDAGTGDLLRTIPLPGVASAVPMSYTVEGRQYVVVAVGREEEPAELVALSLNTGLPEQKPGALGFAATAATVSEGDGEVTLRVDRVGGTDGAVAVTARTTTGGSAAAGLDYEPLDRTLSWGHGDGSPRHFAIRLLDDGAGEDTETIEVSLAEPLGGADVGVRSAVVTIQDDDVPLGPCAADLTTLCLTDGRFRVRARYWTPGDPDSRQAIGTQLTRDTGYFTFFNPANVEIMLKVLNACASHGRFWLFASGLTDLRVELQVTDPVTGQSHVIASPPGELFQPVADTRAFRCE